MTLDRLMGRVENYSENNTDVVPDIIWHQWSLWAQDSWKATRKLTLNIGLRADHMGQWYDKIGGTQVWDPASYNNGTEPPANTGLSGIDSTQRFRTSGWVSQLFFYNPRLGVAYDVSGTGKTVVRAGFGTYRYQVSSNDSSAAMNGPLGSFGYGSSNVGVNGFYGYKSRAGLYAHADPVARLLRSNCQRHSNSLFLQGLNQNGARISRPDNSRATTRFLMRIPTASALHRHCLVILLPRFRM